MLLSPRRDRTFRLILRMVCVLDLGDVVCGGSGTPRTWIGRSPWSILGQLSLRGNRWTPFHPCDLS